MRDRRMLLTAMALVAGLMVSALPAAAQTGRVGGTVKDQNGQPIKGATVLAENPQASPSSFTATTDDKGRFSIIGLRSGTWKITAVESATTFKFARTNANVTATATGGAAGQGTALAAIFEYDAFGRELRASGYSAEFHPFRFSSKFADKESALVYYGYRFYHPGWGRWINRDPIGEIGGVHLMSMCDNAITGTLSSLARAFKEREISEISCSRLLAAPMPRMSCK